MFQYIRSFDTDAIVIDPAVPTTARYALERGFSAGASSRTNERDRRAERVSVSDARRNAARYATPIPFRQSARRAPPPPRVMSDTANRARVWAVFTLVFLVGALIAAVADSLPFVVSLLIVTAMTTAACARAVLEANHDGWTVIVTKLNGEWPPRDPRNWFALHSAAYYHGRYVVPRVDISEEDRRVWDRAIVAAHEICGSEVFRMRRIDSDQVAADLPNRLWEIAEALARLSKVRERLQAERDDDPNDDVGAIRMRGRELMRRARDIEKWVEWLEEVAAKVKMGDAALHEQAKYDRFKEIDSMILELRARTGVTSGDPDLAGRVDLEVEAVIEQAKEAARSLALPCEGEETGPGA